MSAATPAQSVRYDAFMSHSSKDKAIVEQLAQVLETRAQVRTFLDRWHLTPGEPWQEELEAALQSSNSCVVAIGPGGLGPWQNEEMRAALQRRASGHQGRVIPVALPGVDARVLESLPPFLKRLTMVDLRGGLGDEWAVHQLASGIQGRPPGPGAAAQRVPIEFQVVLSARISEVNLPLLRALTEHLQELTGDTRLTIVRVSEGSVILTIASHQAAYALLLDLFQSGKITSLSGLPIVAIRPDPAVAEPTPTPRAKVSAAEQRPRSGGNKLYVGNLAYSIRDDELQAAFAQFGQVTSAKVMMDRDTGRSKGFGFIEMGSADEAHAAIDGLNGQQIGGRTIVVNDLRPREDGIGSRGRRRDGGGGSAH